MVVVRDSSSARIDVDSQCEYVFLFKSDQTSIGDQQYMDLWDGGFLDLVHILHDVERRIMLHVKDMWELWKYQMESRVKHVV